MREPRRNGVFPQGLLDEVPTVLIGDVTGVVTVASRPPGAGGPVTARWVCLRTLSRPQKAAWPVVCPQVWLTRPVWRGLTLPVLCWPPASDHPSGMTGEDTACFLEP